MDEDVLRKALRDLRLASVSYIKLRTLKSLARIGRGTSYTWKSFSWHFCMRDTGKVATTGTMNLTGMRRFSLFCL